jgi:cobalt-zinc-cadmium efflux system protein
VNNIVIALVANLAFSVIEFFGGIYTNSTAIQADAIHDFGDASLLAVALLMQTLASRPPRQGYTYGYKRLSLLSAILASFVLFMGSLYILRQAWIRLENPEDIHIDGMFLLAVLGVVVNGFSAWRVGKGKTQNEKALYWHMMEDLLGWIAILVSSIVLRFFDVPWLDPMLALLISLIVLVGGLRSFMVSLKLFLQAVPSGISENEIKEMILKIPGVSAIEAFKFWSLDGQHHVCSLTISLEANVSANDWSALRQQIEHAMHQFGKVDLTVQPIFYSK